MIGTPLFGVFTTASMVLGGGDTRDAPETEYDGEYGRASGLSRFICFPDGSTNEISSLRPSPPPSIVNLALAGSRLVPIQFNS
jgi:hypothetical protein